MSEEETVEEPVVEQEEVVEESPSPSQAESTPQPAQEVDKSEKAAEKMAKKFRLIKGEEILETKQPSFLAFFPYYLLGVIVFGIHWLYSMDNWETLLSEDPGFGLKLLATLLDTDVVFTIVMVTVAWFNRMLNTSTSNGWIGVWLMLTALIPMFTIIDNTFQGADWYPVGSGNGILPEDVRYLMNGLVSCGVFFTMLILYQRSFNYAITTDAIIFHHGFLLSRSHRRLLFDRISEVIVNRTPIGTMMGFATISILTDSGVGLVEETKGGAIGASGANLVKDGDGDAPAEKVSKNMLKMLFAVVTYQRTVTKVKPDPKNCFYSIRGWADTKDLLNEKHKQHSQSTLLQDLKESLTDAINE